MLTAKHQRLNNIELTNLMQWSDTDPPLTKGTHVRDLIAHIEHPETKVPFKSRLMIGALDSLADRCTTLTRLRITTVGQDEENVPDVQDDQLYES